jgi:sulfur-oxidizing protein SoxY
MKLPTVLLSIILTVAAAPAHAAGYPADPLESPMWTYHAERIFGAAPVHFDPRVKLVYPEIAENQRAFPVALDARGISGVKRMLIFADLNPIPVAIDYRPALRSPMWRRASNSTSEPRCAARCSWKAANGWCREAGSMPQAVVAQRRRSAG